ncbi:hypothetical protein [Paenibacillus hexagrammi]|uniref:S-adenosylmethionine decarboxylase n=1 Tax=Paenibacillus hexagrammi TaxID=2908839 RepID=A0ABY3SEY9_9BACL|nr:hypothetical protein [Paenibacillus sp. YPD9-1]UJF32025.1 hypothetical protein L0M14_20090 [Paenibacillus sp. YPD9-1]
MKKKLLPKALFYVLVLFLIGWPLYQIFHTFGEPKEEHNAEHLLYQVSLFQIELLNSYLGQAGSLKDTSELDACKQALYSAGYTHERLVLAAGGSEKLDSLESIPQLMQYIQRLQIGGERKLKTEEIATLQETAEKFKRIYEVYEKLMSSDGQIITSQNEELTKADQDLSETIRKKLLE